MSPESPEHHEIKKKFEDKLRDWYGASIDEYYGSGHILDVYAITSSGLKIYVEIVWSRSNFKNDMLILERSEADIKVVVSNPLFFKNENLVREFNKTVISQKRKGVKIWGVMINGERILSDSTYIDSEIKQIFDALIIETNDDDEQYIYERARARERDFYRKTRIDELYTGAKIISMEAAPKISLHLIPVNAIESDEKLDLSELSGISIPPMNTSAWSNKYNFDGYLTFGSFPGSEHAHSYTQIFFNGIIEAVDAFMLRNRIIPSIAYEVELIKIIPKYLETQEKIGAEPPISIMLSLIGVSGCEMALPRGYFPRVSLAMDRANVLIPEILIESFECDIEYAKEVMRPIFDRVWNAAGLSRSFNYDEEGNWIR